MFIGHLWKWVEDCVCLNTTLAGGWYKWILVIQVNIGDTSEYWWYKWILVNSFDTSEYLWIFSRQVNIDYLIHVHHNASQKCFFFLWSFFGWKREREKKDASSKVFCRYPSHGYCQEQNEMKMGTCISGKQNRNGSLQVGNIKWNMNYLRRSGVSWGMRR